MSSDAKLAVYSGFDFEIFDTADTLEMLCCPENVDPTERSLFTHGLIKGFHHPAISKHSPCSHTSPAWLSYC